MIDLERRSRVMSRSLQLGHCICNPKQACPCEIFRTKNVCLCAGEKLPEEEEEIRLTRLVENAGCASKITQADLKQVLAGLPEMADPRVIIGAGAADDAGVFFLDEKTALVQTVDVFTPNVDDPYIFGQIAATNSVSDIYAMGGQPLTALSIIAFPSDRLPLKIMQSILRGGLDKLTEAQTVVLGGHSIKDEEIKFGFAVTGLINPRNIITNNQAQPEDILILTKPLGTGILSFAQQLGRAPEEGLKAAIESMTELNRVTAEVMVAFGVKTATDITGFGLLGHLSEIVEQSRVTALVEANLIPVFPGVMDCLRQGIISGALERNLDYVNSFLEIEKNLPEELLYLLCDPQTSGGILMAVPPDQASRILATLKEKKVIATIIGKILQRSVGKIVLKASGYKFNSIKEVPMSQREIKARPSASACCPQGAPEELLKEKEDVSGERGRDKYKENHEEKEKRIEFEAERKGTATEFLSAALDWEKTVSGEKFAQLIEEVMKTGVLTLREKELIALALAAQSRCEACFEAHLQKALESGLSPDEIKEVLWLGIIFGGAPTLMFIETMKAKLNL